MSVRLRLTLWYLTLLCAGFLLFAMVVLWQTQQAAQSAQDGGLRTHAQDVIADLTLGRTIALHTDRPDAIWQQTYDAWVRVLDRRNRVIVHEDPHAQRLAPAAATLVTEGFHDVSTANGQPVRLYATPILHDGRRIATLQVAMSDDQILAERMHLLRAMGIAGALVLAVGGWGGLFLARRALRPVDRVTCIARGIGAGDLSRRVAPDVAPARAIANDEFGRLVTTFDMMLDRLEKGHRQQRQFAADVAHALCTPIATLISSAEIALNRTRRPDEYRESLGCIVDEARFLGRVVDDLLLLARCEMQHPGFEHELVELDEVCRLALAAAAPRAAARGIALHTSLPESLPLLYGDAFRLGQMLRNLLDNALLYTPPGGTVHVRLSTETDMCDTLAHVMRISDSGPGIPPEEREHIFERFHRGAAGDRERALGGTGLGLAICREIVEAHHGSIGVEDAGPGGGACFVVRLPAVAL